jgi:hypothetical protein
MAVQSKVKINTGTTKKVVSKDVVPKKTEVKKPIMVQRDFVVEIKNNSSAIISHNPKMGRPIELSEYGDKEYVTVAELQEIKNGGKYLLTEYLILITDVIEGDCSIADIYNYIGVKSFVGDEIIDEHFFDSFIVKAEYEDFEKIMDSAENGFKSQVVQRAVKLFKDGSFTFFPKMDYLKKMTENEYLFEV